MERSAGILMHITSLPSPYGIGTLGKAAYDFVDFLQEAGQSLWQVLPLGPTGFGDSPYQSVTAFGGNPYLIDLDRLREEGLLLQEEIDAFYWGDNPAQVNYECIFRHRDSVLKKAFSRFVPSAEWQGFCEAQNAWLEDYALFTAIKKSFGGSAFLYWPDTAIRFREPAAVCDYSARLERETRYETFLQFLFFRQWRALKQYANAHGVSIVGDLPIYASSDSADVWAQPEQFLLDANRVPIEVGGVPPDYFSETGQLWGNPLYDWNFMKKDGYHWWKRRLKSAASLFDAVRIDHFRGLESYWAIPYGQADGRIGIWKKGPAMHFMHAMREAVPHLELIAEDLGFLSETAKRFVRESGCPGMNVLQFAFDGDSKNSYLPCNHKKNSVVYIGTHDNDTLCGWLDTICGDTEKYIRSTLQLSETMQLAAGILQSGMHSEGDWFIVPMQDYLGLGSEARMNIPGTLGKNWNWRMQNGQATSELADRIRKETAAAGRIRR